MYGGQVAHCMLLSSCSKNEKKQETNFQNIDFVTYPSQCNHYRVLTNFANYVYVKMSLCDSRLVVKLEVVFGARTLTTANTRAQTTT